MSLDVSGICGFFFFLIQGAFFWVGVEWGGVGCWRSFALASWTWCSVTDGKQRRWRAQPSETLFFSQAVSDDSAACLSPPLPSKLACRKDETKNPWKLCNRISLSNHVSSITPGIERHHDSKMSETSSEEHGIPSVLALGTLWEILVLLFARIEHHKYLKNAATALLEIIDLKVHDLHLISESSFVESGTAGSFKRSAGNYWAGRSARPCWHLS